MHRGFVRAFGALCLPLLATAMLGAQVRVQAAAPAYELVDVSPTSGHAAAFGVNNAGQVVGGGAGGQGFIWSEAGSTILKSIPRDSASIAVAVNANGLVVGQSRGALPRAIQWKKGKPKLLGKLAGLPISLAETINARGQAVGWASNESGGLWPVLWSGGHAKKLRTLPGSTWSGAHAINNQGQIVGYSEVGGIAHGVQWEGKRFTDLGLLPGYPESSATALNEVGQIVGCAQDGARGKAILWQDGQDVFHAFQ
ncbi:MAG: hypothetical protein EOP49_18590 [Sphingobacteriales bacterium]|nr:MAG: hypothetical protein EOP49_18590 [Sphingobacteriales bacterium]